MKSIFYPSLYKVLGIAPLNDRRIRIVSAVNQWPFFCFFRKLIEGEDCRLSTMVQGMSLMGIGVGVSASLSASGVRVSGALADASSGAGGTSSKLSPPSNNHQGTTEEFSHEQAVEVTERKTVLIR